MKLCGSEEFDLENRHQLTSALEFEVEEDDGVNIDVPLPQQ
jgi:hypothetical protein